MDNKSEVREFLTSRRARLTPEQAGVTGGGYRRVSGLRRGEVATLAGVSVEYYAKLERGNISGASESVLHSIAQALQLDDAERAHLMDLARAAQSPIAAKPRRRAGAKTGGIRPSMQLVLDAIDGGPALIRNGRMDILATNALGRALHTQTFESPGDGNIARYTFLDRRADDFYPNWATAADIVVAILRTEAGRDPYDRAIQDLVGELSTRSDEFRIRWGAHNVRQHGAGTKSFIHSVVGELSFTYEDMQFVQQPGLTFLIYAAEPGSATEERIRLLASWQATKDAADAGQVVAHAEERKE
ncbi:helix-turn-helix transcriptional regulator [Microbacterium sp. PMB16]|uniref:helix-turn-helix transcriptional regulator n=1 Tax=Microbacterium sp. PMB16 TaxID=3120157 RepID=UPI003F4B8728